MDINEIKLIMTHSGFKETAKATDDVDRSLRGLNESAEDTKGAVRNLSITVQKSNTIFTNFFSSLTRVAKLRMLRGIIRTITQAFKEGTENIYRYSQALGAADASHFANTMDSLASSFLYLKNSIGAVVAPLLTSLLPTIQTIINAFVTAINVVAQFFAVLGGQVFYTRAKESAVAWKAVEGAAGGAAAAAQEYKNTILSFDEIHALNDTPSGGGGGGGGGSTPLDYSNMFEEASINPKIREWAEWFKNNWKDILEIVLAIGVALRAWKIADSVASFFKTLGLEEFGSGLASLGFGLVLTITGVTLSTIGGFSIGYEGADLMNIIKTALGIGLAGVGGALAAKGITALGIASVGTGVGAVFGIGIALVGTIVGFTIGEGKAQREAIIANLEEYDGQFKAIMTRQSGYVSACETAWSDYAATLAKAGQAETIVEQLEYFASRVSLTNGEIELAQTLIKQLNNLGLEGVTAAWNEETQQIEINTEAIYKNIEAIKEKAWQTANEKILTAAYEEQGYALIELESAQRLVERATSDYNRKLSQYQGLADAMGITLEELGRQHWFQSIYLADETYALGQANSAVQAATGRYVEATRAVNDTTNALYGDVTAAKTVGNTTINTRGITDGIWGISNASSYGASNTWDLYTSLQYLKNTGIVTSGVKFLVSGALSAFGYHANGGFVGSYADGGIIPRFDYGGISSADIFMANENGNTELIGRIGNRTAVANQQQMVDVLANGVMQAVASSQGGQQSNLEVNVLMDRELLAKAVDRGNRSLNRRYNVSLA